MHKRNLLLLSLSASMAFLSVAQVHAADAAEGPWTGSAGLNFNSASGNSESTNLGADLGLAYSTGGLWTHKFDALAVNSESANVRSAERYLAAYQADYAINARSYFFGKIEGEKDKFSAYDLRTTEALGYGYKLIDTDLQKWNIELGLGATQYELINDGGSESSGVGLIGTDYIRKLSETAEFEQNLDYELASDNNYLNSVTSLRAKVWENIGVKLSYNIKNNSDVPDGVEKTDKYTSIGLDYSF